MPILISKTYSVITPESAEDGDIAESGYEFEDVEYTFSELVRELRDFSELSSSNSDGNIRDWVSTSSEDIVDYRTGEVTEYSLHYSRKNPACNAKYWAKALRAAGFKVQSCA